MQERCGPFNDDQNSVSVREDALLPRHPDLSRNCLCTLPTHWHTFVQHKPQKEIPGMQCLLYTMAWPMHGHTLFGADMITLPGVASRACEGIFPPKSPPSPGGVWPVRPTIDQVHNILENWGQPAPHRNSSCIDLCIGKRVPVSGSKNGGPVGVGGRVDRRCSGGCSGCQARAQDHQQGWEGGCHALHDCARRSRCRIHSQATPSERAPAASPPGTT